MNEQTRRGRRSDASRVVGRQIKRVREELRLSQDELSERLSKQGVALQQPAIARLESGERLITVDDLLAIAAVLGVSPLFLLSGSYTDEMVPVTPRAEHVPRDMRYWMRGEFPLSQDEQETFFELVPDEERLARQWRGLGHLHAILRQLNSALRSEDAGAIGDAIRDMRKEIAWLQQEVAHEQERAERARKEE
jgi:transcriptional regulator with XRE-family HTH domain